MSRVVLTVALCALAGAAGCDLLVEPSAAPPLTVTFQLDEPANPTFAPVLAKVERARLRLERGSSAIDTVVPARPDGGTVHARFAVAVPGGPEPLRIHAELLSFADPVFSGEVMVAAPPESDARVLLTPIPGRLRTPSPFQRFDQLGVGLALWSEVYFATGDLWPNQEADWSSDSPDVVSIEPGPVAVPRGNGSTLLRATYGPLERTVEVSVAQEPAVLTGVGPADTTVYAGDRFQLRAFGEDVGGYPLLPGAQVEWEYEGGIVVDSTGMVTAYAEGTAAAHVVAGDQRRTATITVLTPGG